MLALNRSCRDQFCVKNSYSSSYSMCHIQPDRLNRGVIRLRASRPARIQDGSNLLEEYVKDIQGKGGSSPLTGPVRQDEPVI